MSGPIEQDPLLPPPCAAARRTIQDVLDGPIAAERRREMEAHLAVCGRCREAASGLRAVQAALRSLPEIPLPDEALEEVWSRTIREKPRSPARVWRWGAALAASVLLAALAFWGFRMSPRAPAGPSSPAEIERARAEARQVLTLTAQVLRRGQRAGLERVLDDEISPALRRIPIRWPPAPDDIRRSKT